MSQWGRLTRISDGGFTTVFELDFGGDKVITHVIWADPDVEGHDH
jgi:hypothetical protein